MTEKILIIDFGSQYTQLIARRIREMQVYCEIHPFNNVPALDESIKGVVMSGSPRSVREEGAPRINLDAIKGKLPLLGVCYGAQYLAHFFGGKVEASPSREYGRARMIVKNGDDPLMAKLSPSSQVWMSHGDTITTIPEGYSIIASTEDVPVAAYRIEGEQTWGIQFHPEVYHSEEGFTMIENFVKGICGCAGTWTPAGFVESTVKELKEKLGDDKVVLGLSGGVDSSVAAMLLHKAIGENLYCIFVDSGLLRKDEFAEVIESYRGMGLNVKGVDASEKFLGDLAGVTDPEAKRKIIGRDFVEVFEAEAKQLQGVKWLGQGTIYPDVVESAQVNGTAVVIKSHHNVGGLPEEGDFYACLEQWMEKGKIIVLTTQVENEGSDLGVYHVGYRLKSDLRVLEAYDMTTEAVVAKLMWLLGQTRDRREIEKRFYTPVAKDILWEQIH